MAGYSGALGTEYQSGGTAYSPPFQDLRKYDLSDEIIKRFITDAPLYGILSRKLKKKSVGDPEFKHIEDGETYYTGTLFGASSATNATAHTIDQNYAWFTINGAAKYLQAGQYIYIPYGQTNDSNTTTTLLTGNRAKILSIYDSGTDATNVVTVAPESSDDVMPRTGVAANTLQFYILPAANAEGSTAPDALQDILGTGLQYTEIFRKAVDVTGTRLGTEMWGGSDLRRLRAKAMDFVIRGVERAFLFNKMAKSDVNGKPVRTMGGILDWLRAPTGNTPTGRLDPDASVADWSSTSDLVSGNGTSRVYNVGGTLSLLNWYRFLDAAFQWGSRTKIGLCGSRFISEFQYMMSGKVVIPPARMQWDLQIYDFAAPGGTLNMIHEPAFEGPHALNCLILDLEPLGYAYLNVEEGGKYNGPTDIKLVKDIGENSYYGSKEEVFAEVAIKKAFLKSHAWMTGITATA